MHSANKIIILSGPVQTGKTTSLIRWAEINKPAMGILQPVLNDKRHLLDINTKETKPLEQDNPKEGDVILVGNYKFLKSSFEWAKIVLLHAAKQKPDWLIVDEYGRLELKGQGLEPVITYLVNDSELLISTKLVIVIRDYLVEEAVSKLGININRYAVINDTIELDDV